MNKKLDVIAEALIYAMEIFEENELKVSPNMRKALKIIDEMRGN